jgi:hypothetical protein
MFQVLGLFTVEMPQARKRLVLTHALAKSETRRSLVKGAMQEHVAYARTPAAQARLRPVTYNHAAAFIYRLDKDAIKEEAVVHRVKRDGRFSDVSEPKR